MILLDIATGKVENFQWDGAENFASVVFSSNGKYIICGNSDGSIQIWDITTVKEIKTLKNHTYAISSLATSFDNKYLISGSWDGTVRIWDISTGKEIAQFVGFTDGEWVVITPEGYYNASPGGERHLNVRIGNNVYSIENYREAFYRPDLVKVALSGGSLKEYKTLADVKQPPLVEIIDTPSSTQKDEVKVTVRLTDQGGGIGDVRLYLNDVAVLVDSARGVKITPKPGEKSIYKTYTVKLLNGENVIKAVAFNGDNTMQSNPAVHRIIASLSIKKPSMYAVVIGINKYKNPKLELKYAVSDARLFAETLKQIAGPLFQRVEIKLLTTKEETTKESIKKALEQMKAVSPDDVFVFYVASHGTVDEGEYFLITSNVGSLSTFRLKEDALTQTELKELIANVPSTKKMIVIDTCNAGKLGEALQVAMLTRGMSEETAVKILSRAVGSTILSASTSLQEALEGYQGHGLFTYVLSEGMKGKADMDRDGFIKTLELANYVDSEVPALAEKVFKRAQYPTATPSGQAFPIGKIR
ncbi:caspase family protein [Thermodesulfovibrio sp.]|uniref:caspase family protein n=1 Tax=Thermodesulfovibrio sp. TaxID=2067987 RepID=UPI003C7A6255